MSRRVRARCAAQRLRIFGRLVMPATEPMVYIERIFWKGRYLHRRFCSHVQIGACVVTLELPASHSLKDKRQVVRSLVERLRRKFNVAVAEVEEQETWQTAVLGLTVVSNEAGHAALQIERIVKYIEETRLDAEVVDRQFEVLSF